MQAAKLQALVYHILPSEEGAGKRCSECGRGLVDFLASSIPRITTSRHEVAEGPARKQHKHRRSAHDHVSVDVGQRLIVRHPAVFHAQSKVRRWRPLRNRTNRSNVLMSHFDKPFWEENWKKVLICGFTLTPCTDIAYLEGLEGLQEK